MFRSLLGAKTFVFLMLCVSPCAFAQGTDVERLRIHGSNTLGANLMPALVQSWLHAIGYTELRQVARGPSRTEIRAVRNGLPLVVEIDRRGSGNGMGALIDGRAELAMMARSPNAQEREDGWQLGDLGSPDQEFVVALDGIAVIVHAANPVRELSTAQLRAVLSGQVRDWQQLGGPARPIHLHLPAAHAGSREFLRERVMGSTKLAALARVHTRTTWLASAVAIDRDAIGIVSLRTPLPANVHALAIADGGEAIAPMRLQVMSEDYPLMRRLTLYGGQTMGALGRSFALYTMTARGQQAVSHAGHLAVTLRPAMQGPQRLMPKPYAEVVARAQRLPLSMRFNYSSSFSIFDSRSERDFERLAAFMRLPQNRNRSAVVVAFTAPDTSGSALMSTIASNDRADLVAQQLQQLGIPVQRARGMGALRPLVAPERPGARYRNERVEVWLL